MEAKFKEWLAEEIAEKLDEFADYGRTEYACDLGYSLFEDENNVGSYTCNSAQAKEFIKDHWEQASAYHDYAKENLGSVQNPFENPEAFQVCMVLQGADELLGNAELVNCYWNDKIEVNAATAAIIKDDLGCDAGIDDELLEALRLYIAEEGIDATSDLPNDAEQAAHRAQEVMREVEDARKASEFEELLNAAEKEALEASNAGNIHQRESSAHFQQEGVR